MRKSCIIFLSILLLFISCKDDDKQQQETQPVITDFSIGDVEFSIADDTITGFIQPDTDVHSLVAVFSSTGTVKVNGEIQESGITANDFSVPVKYVVYSDSEKLSKSYAIKIYSASSPVITAFSIEGVPLNISSSGIISGYIPEIIDAGSLAANFTSNGIVTVNDVIQESGVTTNDFTTPVIYKVSSALGDVSTQYTVKLTTFTGLPRLYIITEGGRDIESKEDYVNATFRLEPNQQCDCDVFEGTGKIRGRGHSTWGMKKKPYKIKLDEKNGLLGLPAHKEWTLLANYADKTLMRNYLAYELAALMEMPFVPARKFVEVFLNGKHVGNYMLSDQIEVGKDRVDISKLSPEENDENSITGGYLLEIDLRMTYEPDPTAVWFKSKEMDVVVKYPKDPSNQQLAYITNFVRHADNLLYAQREGDSESDFHPYFDMESTAKWLIVNEFFKNHDASAFSSIYFYKKRNDDKFYMGPVWDFDIAAGNNAHPGENYLKPTGWWVVHQPRLVRMYFNSYDATFREEVKKLWSRYKPQILSIIDEIDIMAEKLDASQKANFTLWPDFEDPSYFVVPGNRTYEGQVLYLKDFLQKRYEWLNKEFQ